MPRNFGNSTIFTAWPGVALTGSPLGREGGEVGCAGGEVGCAGGGSVGAGAWVVGAAGVQAASTNDAASNRFIAAFRFLLI
jgi:hypothetical protein